MAFRDMKIFFIFLSILAVTGCAHLVSQEIRDTVDSDLSVEELFKNPDAFKGEIVILGGIIIDSRNTKEGTYIEVLQKPLNYRGIPRDTDISHGRFIVLSPGFVDTAVFSRGRAVTSAGEVIGKKVLPLDEIEYPYVLIKSRELHLTEQSYGMPVNVGIGIWGSF
jgi:outer membrane lipoprotein